MKETAMMNIVTTMMGPARMEGIISIMETSEQESFNKGKKEQKK